MPSRIPLALFTTCLLTTAAHAQQLGPNQSGFERQSEPAVTETRYGAYTAIVDGVATGMVLTSFVTESDNGRDTDTSELLFTLGLPSMLLGAPVVHLAHGNPGRAIGSLGIRLALGLTGVFVGSAMFDSDDPLGFDGAVGGMMVGLTAAAIIDATVLAKEQVPVERPQIAPSIGVANGGATLQLAGAF